MSVTYSHVLKLTPESFETGQNCLSRYLSENFDVPSECNRSCSGVPNDKHGTSRQHASIQ